MMKCESKAEPGPARRHYRPGCDDDTLNPGVSHRARRELRISRRTATTLLAGVLAPKVVNLVRSCATLAATQLCEQIPFPGSSICKSGIDGEFPCPK